MYELPILILMIIVSLIFVGAIFTQLSPETFKNLGGLSPEAFPEPPTQKPSPLPTDITLGSSASTPITSQTDLLKMIDKGPKDMYGSSIFYRNLYYQNPEDLQKYLTINGMNHISPDVYIRNIPINDSYKTNEDGYFFIRQPIIKKQSALEKEKGDETRVVDDKNPV